MQLSNTGWIRLSLLAGLLLTSCSTAPRIEYVPQKVEVPVIQPCPKVTVQPIPHLDIQDLKQGSTQAEIMAAWVASLYRLQGDDLALRALLKPYSK